jgi:TolB-like protein/Flp pilus assembly protein TadD
VLPFTNRSGLIDDDVFAMGMVEDVVAALAQGVHVRVLSSSSTARFAQGPTTDIAALGAQLGVRYLLEGNIRRVGENLRVTAQLVEAARGEILWTQRFDRNLAELSALQEELVSEVAANLGTQVYRREIERALKKPDDLTAWECVTRAEGGRRDISIDSFLRSRAEAERAVAIAPDYGLAHAILAQTISLIFWLRAADAAETRHTVERHVAHALALDPDNAAVINYAAQALVYIGNPEEGLRHAMRAILLSPFHGMAHFTAGNAHMMLGHAEEALEHYRTFLRLDPHSHLEFVGHYNIGRTYLGIAEWQQAEIAFAKSLDLNTTSPALHLLRGIASSKLGNASSARAMVARARGLEPDTSLEDWVKRLTLWHPRSEKLGEILDELRVLWRSVSETQ